MDSTRFDHLTRQWSGIISRRGAVRGLLGSLGAGLIAVRQPDEAAAGVCSGQDQCDGTGSPTCAGRDNCHCYKRRQGGTICGKSNSISCNRKCRRDKQCPDGYFCSSGGPACCGSGERFCVKKCRRRRR